MSNNSDNQVTGPIETVIRGPRQSAMVALGTATVGSILAIVGFYASIGAALDGSGSGPTVTLVILYVGLILDLAAIVLAIVSIVRGSSKTLPFAAMLVALLPAIVLAVLAIGVRV